MEKITFEEFDTKFDVRRNPIRQVSPYENTMLDYDDEELEYLDDEDNDRIWTIVESNFRFLLIPGKSEELGTTGYFLTKKPWAKKQKEYELT